MNQKIFKRNGNFRYENAQWKVDNQVFESAKKKWKCKKKSEAAYSFMMMRGKGTEQIPRIEKAGQNRQNGHW